MIGEASGAISTIPPHVLSTCAREKIGNNSNRSRELVFDHMKTAALCIGIEGVGACPHHQFTFVGLADINMNSAAHHYGIEHLFKQWTDQCLQWPALDWNGEIRRDWQVSRNDRLQRVQLYRQQ